MSPSPVTVPEFRAAKGRSEKLAVVTAYDFTAAKLLKAGAAAVKLEGGERMADAIAACVRADIPVMGHVGLTPQSVNSLGGYKVQRDADRVLADAKAVADSGAFAVVLECVPTDAAAKVTAAIPIPTIGIGAGPHCDGQVLVFHDLLGLYDAHTPKFVRRYASLGDEMRAAIVRYVDDIRAGRFPNDDSESFHMSNAEELRSLYGSANVVEMPRQ